VHTEKNNDRDQDHITLSSIHQAKGLEWPVVFVPWLVDGKFPSEFALDNPDGEDEERRLFYVAITRAQEELYLSYPIMLRAKDWTQMICRPSRFIAFESIENFCERWELSWSHEESNDEKQQLSS
jgi:DNA helicase-2/ATP-dependent DNA helicase PcrA